MASLIDLRRRIRSVRNMQQITRAMKMVSAARLRRAQERVLQARPYALELRKVIANLAGQLSGGGEPAHPLLEQREVAKTLLVVVTGDKGLCGSFNANVLRRAERELGKLPEPSLLLIGKRAGDYFRRRKRYPVRAAHRGLFSDFDYGKAGEIAADMAEAFVGKELDAVYLVYNQFVSVMTQKLTFERLLPLETGAKKEAGQARSSSSSGGYIYEPSPEALLEALLPRFVAFQIYRVLLESQASEQAARMTAMEAATKNAGELIDRLTLIMNRKRQATITKELIEVVSGAQALEG